ncbi:MAG: hypothetical protein QF842_06475 [Candidatus Marinimicrobia bacterium]|nr:hypothetical protein [Candidatus Neomarinimicrobiota bacterium]MDP6610959.1 hypothetical protein [Candidatus Neomarinimicrobiota bacterium]|tara:strand:- start:12007 stop:15447 length:3441 start_codon:yes stop_codon:yes gene_type:complete
MKSIEQYLAQIRQVAIKSDIKVTGWIIYSISLLLFLSGLMLESVFYFSSFIRFTFWLIIFVLLLIGMAWLIVAVFKIRNNTFDRYRWSKLAKITGKFAFPKDDTLINALQIERSAQSSASAELSDAFIEQTTEKLGQLNLSDLFPMDRINRWKNITLVSLITTILALSFTWKHSVSSLYRWAHPELEFVAPKPFTLKGITRHVHLLGGDDVTVSFSAKGEIPDSIYIEFKPVTYEPGRDSLIVETVYTSPENNNFAIELKEVFQDYRYRAFYFATEFWQPWKEVSSKRYSISVTDRPTIKKFSVTIRPPAYTGLASQIQKANQAEIQALKGSKILVQLNSNRKLSKAKLVMNGERKKMKVKRENARYQFTVENDSEFYIHLTDVRGITNRNPIPFKIQMIPDVSPEMMILQPPPIVELGNDQSIPIIMTIEDDFGFSNLQLAYEIQRPSYIQVEPFISIFSIPIEIQNNPKQEVNTIWRLGQLGLMPEDEVHYHFELYDNDEVSGPKKSISGTFIARVPSLKDLFLAFNEKEEELADAVEIELNEIQKLQKQLKKAELNLLKTDKPEWKDQQALKETLEEVKDKLADFEALAEDLEALNHSGEKHKLFSEDLMQKFQDLQKLIEEIFPPDMLKNMDWMREALEKLDAKDLLLALENISNNLEQVEQELDRFLDIFKRVKAEQQVDELRKRIQQLVENQDNIDKQIRRTTPQTDPSVFEHLSVEEKMSQKELDDIRDNMNSAARDVKEFSRKTTQALENLADSDDAKSSENHLKETVKSLEKQNPYRAMDESYAGLQSLESMENSMDNILADFQRETTREMAQKFRAILRDVLSLSKTQESLQKETQNIPRNSPRLRDLAGQQQMLQDQLAQTMKNTMDLSRETFMVSPEMGRKMGSAFAQMDASKGKLAERNGSGSLGNQGKAMLSLNEGAKTIIQTVKQMQESGSASGYEEFLKRMEEMAGQQKGINDQGMQLALGQMAASMQQQLIQQLLAQQRGVRKSLQQMMDEMRQAGNQGLGDLSGIANEMDEVLKDLEMKRYTRQTSDRQQRILSRMLDSQKSMTQRGFEEERKSETGDQTLFTGPAGLPQDLGQRQSLIMNAMNHALKSGYSRDYQKMIRRYFNALNEAESVPLPNTNSTISIEGINP